MSDSSEGQLTVMKPFGKFMSFIWCLRKVQDQIQSHIYEE